MPENKDINFLDYGFTKQEMSQLHISGCFLCYGTKVTACITVDSGLIECPYCKKEE